MNRLDFLDTCEFSEQQVLDIMNLAVTLKACVRADYYPPLLKKKCIAIILSEPDPYMEFMLATAIHQLGGYPQILPFVLDTPEMIRDAATQLGRSCDLACVKCQRHETLLALAKYADLPIVNMGSSHSLPAQEIADLITMFEHLPREKKLEECKVVYEGGNCPLCVSVLYCTTKIGMQFVQLSPDKKSELQPPSLKIAERNVKKSGGTYTVTDNSGEAYRGADFLIMDAPLSQRLNSDAEGVLRVDPFENRVAAYRSILTCMLYQNPAEREPLLIEKMKRMLAVKLQSIFGFGEAGE